jgi:DNA modification methylase
MPSPRAPVHLQEVASLDSLKPAPNNPRRHDLGAIIESLKANGFVDDIVVDRRTGCILGGHGRWEALKAMQKAGDAPPDRVSVKGGKWYVPVNREVASRNDTHAARIVIVLNRAADLADNDEAVLAQMLVKMAKEHELAGSGYDGDALDDLLKDLGAQDTSKDDLVPEPPKKAISKPGDLWTLGQHRILCGDSTKPRDVARLMESDRAMLLATDPPYGVAYGDETGSKKHGKIANDENNGPKLQAFLEDCFRAAVREAIAPNAAWYLWHAQLTQGFFAAAAAAAAAAAVLISRQIIWVKPALLLGHGDYHWKHELCFYGWVQGHRPPFYGKRNQTTVWEMGNETLPKDRKHPTQKPVALWDAPIHNHTKPGEVLYEPFAGSGTQIIAAEKTGRRCRAIEIEPRYVDVAVERWQIFAHGKATRQSR